MTGFVTWWLVSHTRRGQELGVRIGEYLLPLMGYRL